MVYNFTRQEGSAEYLFSNYSVFRSPVELAIGFAFTFASSSFTVRLMVSIFCRPPCWVAFRVEVFHVT